MFNRLSVLFSLVAVIVILVMISFTTPSSVGPLGVLVFFTMIYTIAFGIANLVVAAFLKAAEKTRSVRKGHYMAATIAFGPIMLLLVKSFGALSVATILMVVAFVVLGCFLIEKRF